MLGGQIQQLSLERLNSTKYGGLYAGHHAEAIGVAEHSVSIRMPPIRVSSNSLPSTNWF
jgi:hypothetical protein